MSTLEEDIAQVRADLITKDDQLRELTQQAASEDREAAAEAAAEVKKLKSEKNGLQAQLECKSRQLKVSFTCLCSFRVILLSTSPLHCLSLQPAHLLYKAAYAALLQLTAPVLAVKGLHLLPTVWHVVHIILVAVLSVPHVTPTKVAC